MIALGVVILLNPFQSAQALITFIGICMLLDGVINLWNAFVVWQHLRVLKKAASAAIDTIAAAVDAANGNAPADVVVDAVSTADAPAEEPTAEQPVEENTPQRINLKDKIFPPPQDGGDFVICSPALHGWLPAPVA